MIDLNEEYSPYITFLDIYLMQDGDYFFQDFDSEINFYPMTEDERLVRVINSENRPIHLGFYDILKECEDLLSLRNSVLRQYIDKKLPREPEEYTPEVEVVQTMLKKVKSRLLWQLRIAQGIDIEKDIIRLPGEVIQPLTTLSAVELKQQHQRSMNVKENNTYRELCKKHYGNHDHLPTSGLAHLSAYLHQDYAYEAIVYLQENPDVINTVEEFWGKSYTLNIRNIDSDGNITSFGKHLIAIQIIKFFSTINKEKVSDLSGAFHAAVANEIEALLANTAGKDINEELSQQFNYQVILDTEMLCGALLYAQRFSS